MSQGLSVSRLIRVTVNLQPLAAQRRGFGSLLILGDSDVLAINELAEFDGADGVAARFGISSPEYLESQAYFGQTPRPRNCYIGRWAREDIAARLLCGILSSGEQAMPSWIAITTGSFSITIGDTPVDVVGINLSAETNLNGVASKINEALVVANVAATCSWDGQRFSFTTDDAGASVTIGYLGAAATGVDISTKLKGTLATNALPYDGVDAESPADAVLRYESLSAKWFGLSFSASTNPTDDEFIAVAGLVETFDVERVLGITVTNTGALDPLVDTDLGSRLKALGYNKTVYQYSQNRHAIASFFGRAFSVNFSANRSVITLMYKQEPGIAAEELTPTQATALKDKNYNVFVEYENDTAIIQYGKVASGAYFDEIHGLAWFRDALQNGQYNLLYQSKTKIPQTDPGQAELYNGATAVCSEAVNNGLVAPGVWNADGFGQLQRGDYLKTGFYIYCQPMALQDQSQREARIAPPMQIALKLAGAIHEIDVIVDVNR